MIIVISVSVFIYTVTRCKFTALIVLYDIYIPAP